MAFAWHASIFVRQGPSFTYICGGSLVSKSFILTAAHCVAIHNHDPHSVRIQLGATFFVSNCIRIHVHPLYLGKAGNYGSDVALLELQSSVRRFDESIHPVAVNYWKLEDITALFDSSSAMMSMGYVPTKNESSLRIIAIPIVGYAECVAGQQKDFWKFITFTSFCAGRTDGSGGVCNGDSGSGLVVFCPRTGIWWLKV